MRTMDLEGWRLPKGSIDNKQLFGSRLCYAQELRAAGVKYAEIGPLLHIAPYKVRWYCEPEGFSWHFFPVPGIFIDPSPVDGNPVFYDEWGKPHRDPNYILMRLGLLEARDEIETRYDYDRRETLFRYKPKPKVVRPKLKQIRKRVS